MLTMSNSLSENITSRASCDAKNINQLCVCVGICDKQMFVLQMMIIMDLKDDYDDDADVLRRGALH